MKIISRSVKDTLHIGAALARHLKAGDIICLKGELGTGKTTLSKGIASGLKVNQDKVTSSSFVLIRQHLGGRLPLFHFDLYRLKQTKDIAMLGYEEYLYDEGVSVIEWPEKLDCLMLKERLMVKLSYAGENRRVFEFSGEGARYKALVKVLDAHISH